MIKESPGFFYTFAVLIGALGIGMLFGAFWSFEAGKTVHVVFSISMAAFSAWFAVALCRRAYDLQKEGADPDRQRTTRGM
jgi:hypothetical protein